MGIRFKLGKGTLEILGPDGTLFQNPTEIALQRNETERALAETEAELHTTEHERDSAKRERDAVKQDRGAVKQERDAERERVALLLAKLRQLGVDPADIS